MRMDNKHVILPHLILLDWLLAQIQFSIYLYLQSGIKAEGQVPTSSSQLETVLHYTVQKTWVKLRLSIS